MENLYYEVQGFTWRAKASKQQDALFIGHKVIQHDGIISKCYTYLAKENWCIAVADGISNSPYAAWAAKTLLKAVQKQAIHAPSVYNLAELQTELTLQLTQHKQLGASSTLALISKPAHQYVINIQHLGDSRVYLYRHDLQQWTCLTQDHNFLEQLRDEGKLQDGIEYASFYSALMHYFCADPEHEVPNIPPQKEYLTPHDTLLICSDGLHDVLHASDWPILHAEMSLKTWIILIQQLLTHQADDNVSMILVRLKNIKSSDDQV